jgi:hypothetical protein
MPGMPTSDTNVEPPKLHLFQGKVRVLCGHDPRTSFFKNALQQFARSAVVINHQHQGSRQVGKLVGRSVFAFW